MKKLLLLLTLVTATYAASTYNSVQVSANAGDASWATFYFGHPPNGQPGSTALIVQCTYHRAQLVTNFEVYGLQRASQFFTASCTESGTYSDRTFSLNATPLTEQLTMTGRDDNNQLVSEPLILTVLSAQWRVQGYGRGATDTGSAQIVY